LSEATTNLLGSATAFATAICAVCTKARSPVSSSS